MPNKKVLIITFQCCPNYGAMLQAYALQEYLKTLSLDVEILDYRPKSLTKQYVYINTYSLASIIMSIWSLASYYRKRRAFKRFEQYLNLTGKTYYSKNNIDMQYIDYCFLGSDQIWNPEITSGFDPVYFGNVNLSDSSKIIAYAASIGKKSFTSEEVGKFKTLITKIHRIAMREDEAQDLVLRTTGKKTSLVVDPTILAGVECFRKFINKVKFSKYVLVYRLSSDLKIIDVANEVANRKGLKVIEISGLRKGIRNPKHKVIYDAGVEDYLSLLFYADYVVTDSFHGTVFSVLFHKQFITIPHKTRGGRMKSLLSKVNLLDRISSKVTDDLLDKIENWNDVDMRLDEERAFSQTYIKNSCI